MNIKTDSRKIKKGDTFLALRGPNDGHKYVEEAINNGAEAVIVEEGFYSVITIQVPNTREYLINYLDSMYHEQISKLKLIGVTGTNGKTTICYLTHKVLNKLGHKCAYIGTIGFYIDNKICDLDNTTPDIFCLYELLITCIQKKCTYVVMEVSSHSLELGRIGKLKFDYAIFTNLTQDHLDYHQTFENYAMAKQKLFKILKNKRTAIINNDDSYKDYFIIEDNNNILYGKKGNYILKNIETSINGSSFELNNHLFETKLIGDYNVYNLAPIIILLYEIGIKYQKVFAQIKELIPPPGRLEIIEKDSNKIVIDYAHTPDALEKVINVVRKLQPNNIITIIGCGGNRDKQKRPIIANIATTLSDYVIFTNDNPRHEEPRQIITDMLHGLDSFNYEIIVNREEAIIKGIQKLQKNDILLVLGKGHETYQVIGDKKEHFDDKEVVINNI